jgi:hypothetical protein
LHFGKGLNEFFITVEVPDFVGNSSRLFAIGIGNCNGNSGQSFGFFGIGTWIYGSGCIPFNNGKRGAITVASQTFFPIVAGDAILTGLHLFSGNVGGADPANRAADAIRIRMAGIAGSFGCGARHIQTHSVMLNRYAQWWDEIFFRKKVTSSIGKHHDFLAIGILDQDLCTSQTLGTLRIKEGIDRSSDTKMRSIVADSIAVAGEAVFAGPHGGTGFVGDGFASFGG